MAPEAPPSAPAARTARTVGRYALYDEIASGGMATVHLGRLVGPVGFSRTVAIKRLHAHYAKDAEFVAMFLDEARLVARIRHPNVCPTLDVVQEGDELLLVMEYVQGESLSKLVKKSIAAKKPIPPRVAAAVMVGVLHGLHAAHEAKGEHGEALHIVHRDVSPQNVMVGTDGVPRLLDFGVAKATQRSQSTRDGQVKGKLAYMAPEQIQSDAVDRRSDVFAAGVVLWEALTQSRLFDGPNDARILQKILSLEIPPPSATTPEVTPALDAICIRALSRDPAKRFQSAREMALALEREVPLAMATEIGEWAESLAHDAMALRAARVLEIESRSDVFPRAIGHAPTSQPSGAIPAPAPSGPSAVSSVSAAQGGLDEPPVSGPRPASSPRFEASTGALERRSRAPLVALGGGAILLVGLVVGALLMRGGAKAVAPASTGAPSTPPVESAAPTSVAHPPSTTPQVDLAASASAAPSPAPSATPRATASAAKPAKPPPTATGAKPAANCDTNPFYVDAKGIRHVRSECL